MAKKVYQKNKWKKSLEDSSAKRGQQLLCANTTVGDGSIFRFMKNAGPKMEITNALLTVGFLIIVFVVEINS